MWQYSNYDKCGLYYTMNKSIYGKPSHECDSYYYVKIFANIKIIDSIINNAGLFLIIYCTY